MFIEEHIKHFKFFIFILTNISENKLVLLKLNKYFIKNQLEKNLDNN